MAKEPPADDLQRHVHARSGEVAPYVLLPGDPARAERIAEVFAESTRVAHNREFTLFTGTTQRGSPISVCSTGVGGPSAAIAIEELARIGATHFIRVGSAGARQPEIPIGTVVIVTAAYRGEGTSSAYLPLPFPAVADFEVTSTLIEAARSRYEEVHSGIVFTRDAFYQQDRALNQQLTEAGVVASEMECATLFVAGSVLRVKVGAVLGTDSNIWLKEQPSPAQKQELYMLAEPRAIAVAVDAVDLLHQRLP
ncbi:MAG: nucleoside phosphorylase [Trueperaceae bacterium]|nr:MAG: nucleoside phosphorylase [Trueperaceae bacterium]